MDQTAALLGAAMGGHVGLNPTAAISTPRHLAMLAGFALSNVLLAFDYDGTLAPIADTPAKTRACAPAHDALLTSVARAYPCVVISGRALADITRDAAPRAAVVRLRQPWTRVRRARSAIRIPNTRDWVAQLDRGAAAGARRANRGQGGTRHAAFPRRARSDGPSRRLRGC